MWASYGILSAHSSSPTPIPSVTNDFVKAILGVAAVLFALKVAAVGYRQCKRPLNKVQMSP